MTSPAIPKLPVVLPPSVDGSSFAIYQAASAPQVQVTLPEGARAEDFFIDAVNYQLPRAVVTRVRTCAQNIRRGPAEIAQDATATAHMYLHVAGESVFAADGHSAHMGPGDIVLVDSRLAYESRASAFDARILMVPRDRVPSIFLSPDIHGLRLGGEEAGTRLLAAAMETLVREIEGLAVSEADHAVMALYQLAAGLVETQIVRRGGLRGEPSLDAALAFIGHRLKDPALSPDAVRTHLGISRSGLYRMFAPFGGIDALIRQRRLDDTMRALLGKNVPNLSIAGLAARQGFRNETQLSRAFQARFGTTPMQVRAKVAAGDTAWLKAQAKAAGFTSLDAWRRALGA